MRAYLSFTSPLIKHLVVIMQLTFFADNKSKLFAHCHNAKPIGVIDARTLHPCSCARSEPGSSNIQPQMMECAGIAPAKGTRFCSN